MSALASIRSASGLLNASPAKRREAALQAHSMARAGFFARLRHAAEANGGPAAAVVKSAAKSGGTSGSGQTGNAASPVSNELSRDAFLQLLVTQMQNQDPMEPVDNSEMIAQLAQFSALEQMENLNDSFQYMSGNIDQLNFINASSMLGRRVSGVDVEGNTLTGTVERVHMDGSLVYLTVDGQLMSMAGVMGIEMEAP